MDKTVPAGAALLLDFIGGIEAPHGYDTIYGNNQNKLAKPLTTMTLGDIVDAQKSWTKRFRSSACGRYQFMRKTLQGLATELTLQGTLVFTPDFQDRLGYHLLKRRGYSDYVAGKINRTEFAKRLAQEWASLPVLSPVQGASRSLTRGQSYYAGDGLNKSLVDPAKVEQILMLVVKAPEASLPAKEWPLDAPQPPEEITSKPIEPKALEPKKPEMEITSTAPSHAPDEAGFWASLLAMLMRAMGFGK